MDIPINLLKSLGLLVQYINTIYTGIPVAMMAQPIPTISKVIHVSNKKCDKQSNIYTDLFTYFKP